MRIVFAHNVYNRFQTLQETIRLEKHFFPDSYSIIAYNDVNPKYHLEFPNIELVKFTGLTHKIGCVNGCMVSIKEAIKYDPDFVIFSHDDVFIKDYNKVIENLTILRNGEFDAICRRPLPSYLYGENYYLMEVFFMSKNGAEKCFSGGTLYTDENNLPRDVRQSLSPEVFLYDKLKENEIRVYERSYIHQDEGYNDTLTHLTGFHHKNAGSRGWIDF